MPEGRRCPSAPFFQQPALCSVWSATQLACVGGLAHVNVFAISFGQLRDLWVPMVVLALSLTTALLGSYRILTSSFW